MERLGQPVPTPTFALHEWTDILDQAALQKLAELDPQHRAGLVLKLLHMFASSLNTYAAQMAAARTAQDNVTARRVAHTVRTSAKNMGAVGLALIAGTCETLCGADAAWAASPLIDEFIACCNSTRESVEARLPGAV